MNITTASPATDSPNPVVKEVSLDSQSLTSGNRVSVAQKDTLKTHPQWSASVDESIQVDLPKEPVKYDSDDEIVKKRKGMPFGGLKSKKGFPIYSREDIREQYCINRKELQVFEEIVYHHHGGLFGCLSTSHLPDHSPCNRNSYFLSCMQKAKCSTEMEKDDDNSKKRQEMRGQEEEEMNCEEDEDSDGGFKRKSHSRTHALADSRYQWSKRPTYKPRSMYAIDRVPVSISSSNTPYSSHGIRLVDVPQNYFRPPLPSTRPNLLHFRHKENCLGNFKTSSKSFDELSSKNDPSIMSKEMVISKSAKTPDHHSFSEDRAKHVSFDPISLIRSNTVIGGLETPSSTNYSYNSMVSSFTTESMAIHDSNLLWTHDPPQNCISTNNQSHERLIQGVPTMMSASYHYPSHLTFQTHHHRPTISQTCSAYYPSRTIECRSMRRVVMKTQAAQTDPSLIPSVSCIPAYLTLSPRARAAQQAERTNKSCKMEAKMIQRDSNSCSNNNDKTRKVVKEKQSVIMDVSVEEAIGPKSCSGPVSGQQKVLPLCDYESTNKVKNRTRSKTYHQHDSTSHGGKHFMSEEKRRNDEEKMNNEYPICLRSQSFHVLDDEHIQACKEEKEVDKSDIYAGFRRHSVAAEFLSDTSLPLLYPPPGFEDVLPPDDSDLTAPDNAAHRVLASSTSTCSTNVSITATMGTGDSPSMDKRMSHSSSDTSRAVCSAATDDEQSSLTEMDELNSRGNSIESPTMISEISSNILVPPEIDSTSSGCSNKNESLTGSVYPQLPSPPPPPMSISSSSASSSVQKLKSLFEGACKPSTPKTVDTTAKSHSKSRLKTKSAAKPTKQVSSESGDQLIGPSRVLEREESWSSTASGNSVEVENQESERKYESNSLSDQKNTELTIEMEKRVAKSMEASCMEIASQFSSSASSSRVRSPSGESSMALDVTKDYEAKTLLPGPSFAHRKDPLKSPRSSASSESDLKSFADSSPLHQSQARDSASESIKFSPKNTLALEEMDSGTVTPICELGSSDPSTALDFNSVIENPLQSPPFSMTLKRQKRKDKRDENSEETKKERLEKDEGSKVEIEKKEEEKAEEEEEEDADKKMKASSHIISEDVQYDLKRSEDQVQVESRMVYSPNDADEAESEGDPVESDDLEAFPVQVSQDINTANVELFCSRGLSTELSTVSEVSEEMSNPKYGHSLSDTSSSSCSLAPGLQHDTSADATLNKSHKSLEMDANVGQGEKLQPNDVDDDDPQDRTEASSPSSYSQSSLPGSSFLTDGQFSLPLDGKEMDKIEAEPEEKRSEDIKEKLIERDEDAELGISYYNREEETGDGKKRMSKTGSLPLFTSDEANKDPKVVSESALIVNKILSMGEQLIFQRFQVEDKVKCGTGIPEDRISLEQGREDIAACQTDTAGESSQATERDMARFEFSLTQHSSQDIDEESLSLIPHLIEKSAESLVPISPSSITILSSGQSHLTNVLNSKYMEEEENLKANFTDEQETKQQDENQGKESISSGVQQPKQDSLTSEISKATELEEVSDLRSAGSERKTRVQSKVSELHDLQRSASSAATCSPVLLVVSTTDANSSSGPNQQLTSEVATTSSHVPSHSRGAQKNREAGHKSSQSYRKSATIEDMVAYRRDDDEDIGVYSNAYKSATWFYISKKDELRVWCQRQMSKSISWSCNSEGSSTANNGERLQRSDSLDSTCSEKSFKRQYEAVTHRMIHRRASIVLYSRIKDDKFVVEKSVSVVRNNGEFGFRIHGSRPVVVSAVEKGSPAESCGLEVGDIVVTVNGTNVLDSSHSEVVRLAHAGSDTLKLELVRTCQKLREMELKEGQDEIYSGYLHRRSESLACASTLQDSIGWKRRWFILRTDSCLYWYSQPKDTKLLGAINLQNYTASFVQSASSEACYVIRLAKIEGPSCFLYASNESTATQWLNHVNSAASKVSRANPYIEKTLRSIHVKPLSIKDSDCRGFLGIFGQKHKLWKQRYFVLKEACLYSYIDISSSTALGVFYLQGHRVQSTSLVGKRNTFEISPPDRNMKHLWLMAESEIDKKRWLAALEYSIDRWIRLT